MRTSRGRHQPFFVAAVLVCVVGLAGCGDTASGTSMGGGGSDESPTQSASPSGGSMLSQALAAAGYKTEAEAVRGEAATVTEVDAGLLSTWRIMKVEVRNPSHPVLFYVGFNGQRAVRLTGSGSSFNEMVEADAGKVRDAASAEALAKTYVETTRSMSTLSYTVSAVEDIRWLPNLDGKAKARRDEIVSRFSSKVTPPKARQVASGFEVTVYVVHGQELQRRTLTVSSSGTVEETMEVLVKDLPVPFSM